MIAILIITTFLVAVTLDHILTRKPITVAPETRRQEPARPRLVPSIVAGFELPDNLRYHAGHTWAVAETPDLVRVGIDDFAAKLVGDVKTVDTPQRGQWIRQGQRIFAMHHDGRDLGLVSPIEGTVVDVNQAVLDDPKLSINDPYGEGWLVKVNAPDATTNFRNLFGGTIARRWLDDAAAQLRAFAVPAHALAQDGGVAVNKIIDQLPDPDWQKLSKDLFLC